jgi:hypothetical protein
VRLCRRGNEAILIFAPILGPVSVAKLSYALFLRALTAVGGAIALYGTYGMFTTGGIMPPNAIVIAGLAACGAAALALWSSERTFTGVWPAFLIVALPLGLSAFGSLSEDECPQPHLPITQLYSCATVGSHALAVVAPAVTLVGVATLVLDMRTLTRGRGGRPIGS